MIAVESSTRDPDLTSEVLLSGTIRKARLPVWKIWVLGNLAGAFVCCGAQVAISCMATSGSSSPSPTKWFGGFAFSTALMMIILTGAELFSGNCLIIVALLERRICWYEMLRAWFVVYFSNFFGIIVFAAVIYGGGINGYHDNPNPAGTLLCTITSAKADLTAWEMFLRGIGANYLVCMSVLLAISSKTTKGKMFGVALPFALFFLIGLEHTMANLYFFTAATYVNCPVRNHGYYWLNILLSTFGNVIGAAMVAVPTWAGYIDRDDDCAETLPHPSEPLAIGVASGRQGPQVAGDSVTRC